MENPLMNESPLSAEQLRDLTNRIRKAYQEMCQKDECDCITIEEHEKNLASI